MGPPKLNLPKVPKPIESFGADPFDARFRGTNKEWTLLGTAMQVFHELRLRLLQEAPDAVAEIEAAYPSKPKGKP